MHLNDLNDAATGDNYVAELEREESSQASRTVRRCDLQLLENGMLQVRGESLSTLSEADKDLAKMTEIPVTYFNDIDHRLRSINVNARLTQMYREDEELQVIISNDNSVRRIQRPRFGQLHASRLVETIIQCSPKDINSNDIRIIEYQRDRRLDAAIISRSRQIEPHNGDIICGGVHVTITITMSRALNTRRFCRNDNLVNESQTRSVVRIDQIDISLGSRRIRLNVKETVPISVSWRRSPSIRFVGGVV